MIRCDQCRGDQRPADQVAERCGEGWNRDTGVSIVSVWLMPHVVIISQAHSMHGQDRSFPVLAGYRRYMT